MNQKEREKMLTGWDAARWGALFTAMRAEREKRYAWKDIYDLYLLSAAWALKRDAAMNRTGSKCGHCVINRASQVHHETYVRLGDERPSDLVPLCGLCHQLAHGIVSEQHVRMVIARKCRTYAGIEHHWARGSLMDDDIADGWSEKSKARRKNILNRMMRGILETEPAVNAIRNIAQEETHYRATGMGKEFDDSDLFAVDSWEPSESEYHEEGFEP